MADFVGAKAALFCGDRVLTLLRDDLPGLAWAGFWDLPGGGREGAEDAAACVLREIAEEVGLRLPPERLVFRREMASMTDPARPSWLFGGYIAAAEVALLRLGDEGQALEMMPLAAFLAHRQAIPEMQRRAATVWDVLGTG